MTGAPFRLGMFARDGATPFAAFVFDEGVVHIERAARACGQMMPAPSLRALLDDWERNFAALQRLAAALRADDFTLAPLLAEKDLRTLPPIAPAGRLFYAAANYRAHVAGMAKTFSNTLPPVPNAQAAYDDKSKLKPYLFLKACAPTGANDDIVLPEGDHRIDWEAELAVIIGRPGQGIAPERAMDHVAGFMTTNDVSCRDQTFRADRPSIRTDWFGGKSFDSFAPMGPYFVPRAFVSDHANLAIKLWVNGEIKQDGNSRDMIFTTEEQIAYAARAVTLMPGDIFVTGTPSGTGQERLEFLKAGDVVETEIEGCGRQRNRVVARG
jgi:2-keto-4-pentenoate hydratase/2-oxohepta-3-ene-1,7-dioic acid hydratase in catechol pathway